MSVVRWVFRDPSTLETYQFAVNPSEGGAPSYNKTAVYTKTSAPDGKVIRFEGRDEPSQLAFSGTLFSEEEFDAFVRWWDKRYQIQVEDDLGRQFYIQIDSFVPTRVRARNYPWKHTYQVAATIIDWHETDYDGGLPSGSGPEVIDGGSP